jgi:4,5-DOPA dioxygenase extradiol
VVSAHWLTQGASFVSTNPRPKTIHDFGGFPAELFAVQYPAPGAPTAAQTVIENVKSVKVHADHEMGLDHGAWSILKHIFPQADVPVFQLSIDWDLSTAQHYALAQELQSLRDKGIMILGSGNVVHNLGRVNWEGGADAKPYDWAVEFDQFVAKNVASGDHQALVDYDRLGAVARMAHPTNDHYLPLLYTLGASLKTDQLKELHMSMDMGSISMRSFELS